MEAQRKLWFGPDFKMVIPTDLNKLQTTWTAVQSYVILFIDRRRLLTDYTD